MNKTYRVMPFEDAVLINALLNLRNRAWNTVALTRTRQEARAIWEDIKMLEVLAEIEPISVSRIPEMLEQYELDSYCLSMILTALDDYEQIAADSGDEDGSAEASRLYLMIEALGRVA